MIYVGIDVASKKHDCYIMSDVDENSNLLVTINNDIEGFTKLKETIYDFMSETNDKVRIGLEATGHYSHNILHYLVREGFDTMQINPLLTNMERKASSVRKTKTDTIDAKSICMFLTRNKDFKPYTIKQYHNAALKSLSRRRISLVRQLSKQKVQLHMLITLTFPEYLKVFSSLYASSSLELLHKYSIPSTISKTRIDALANTLKKASKGKLGHQTALLIKELAANTAGDKNDFYAIQIKLTVEMIRFLDTQIKVYTDAIKVIVDENCPIILSIPGISYVTGAIILGEIGEISLFQSPTKLLAFAGLDPNVYQSGNYSANNLKPSKRGSSYLRWAIHISSSVIIHNDKTFASYYAKKRKEGKHHLVALGHVSKKLIRVIFSILKYDNTFIPNH